MSLILDTLRKANSLFFVCTVLFPHFSYSGLHREPWGKDSEIAKNSCQQSCHNDCETFFFGAFAEAGIKFHQEIISPADGPRSHFFPSSSQYTLEAMRRYGFFQGFLLGCDRLMRENADPWVYKTIFLPNGEEIKYNPIPCLKLVSPR